MKISSLIIASLVFLGISACTTGYYGHLPRAKTQKTETVDNNKKLEMEEITATIKTEDVISPSIETTTLKDIETKNTPTQNRLSTLKKRIKKQYVKFYSSIQKKVIKSPKVSNKKLDDFGTVLLVILAIVLVVIIISAENSLGCLILLLAIVGAAALLSM